MWVRHQVAEFLWHRLGDGAENTSWHRREWGESWAIFDTAQELGILELQLLRLEFRLTELLNSVIWKKRPKICSILGVVNTIKSKSVSTRKKNKLGKLQLN